MNNMLQDNLIDRAARIAVIAHKDQVRKTDGSPYVVHPFMTALKVSQYGFSNEAVAAALVHDVFEDTDYPEEELKKELGLEVYNIVLALSEDKSQKWEVRKERYAKALEEATIEIKAVSIADKIHNLSSVIESHKEQGAEMWEVFNRGKEKKMWFENLVLEAVKKTWKHPLIDEFEEVLREVEKLK